MRDVKAVLCIVGGVVFGAALVYAYAVGLSRWDEDSLEPSGARPDCRHYVAVDELPGNSLPPCGE